MSLRSLETIPMYSEVWLYSISRLNIMPTKPNYRLLKALTKSWHIQWCDGKSALWGTGHPWFMSLQYKQSLLGYQCEATSVSADLRTDGHSQQLTANSSTCCHSQLMVCLTVYNNLGGLDKPYYFPWLCKSGSTWCNFMCHLGWAQGPDI